MATTSHNNNHADQLQLTPQRADLNEPLLTPEQAAALLAVRKSWVYEAAREGRIPHLHVGRHLRFTRAALAAWVHEQRQR